MNAKTSLSRRIVVSAAIAGALGVIIGAFGAHAIPDLLASRGYEAELIEKRLDQFNVGARYHLVHAVALLALGGISWGSPKLKVWASRMFVAGIVLFSGSLYLLVLTNTPKWGAVTPLGGLSWIVAWALVVTIGCRSAPDDPA